LSNNFLVDYILSKCVKLGGAFFGENFYVSRLKFPLEKSVKLFMEILRKNLKIFAFVFQKQMSISPG